MTIYGWDMSHFDAPSIGNAISQGIEFITHKLGGDANDLEADDWWRQVRTLDENTLLGAYWVLYPGRPIARANEYIVRLDAVCPGWRDRDAWIHQIDCEKWNGNANTVPPASDIMAFCTRLRQLAPKDKPIAYVPEWVYGDTLRGMDCLIWASRYVNGSGGFKALYPGDNSNKWGAYSGQVPTILQYTSSATIGGQTTCDANAFRGTLSQLKELVSPGRDPMPSAEEVADKVLAKLLERDEDGNTPLARSIARFKVTNARQIPGQPPQVTNWVEFDRYDDIRAGRSDDKVDAVDDKVDAVSGKVATVSSKVDTLQTSVTNVASAVASLGQPTFNIPELAALLAPAIASAVVEALPPGNVDTAAIATVVVDAIHARLAE